MKQSLNRFVARTEHLQRHFGYPSSYYSDVFISHLIRSCK